MKVGRASETHDLTCVPNYISHVFLKRKQTGQANKALERTGSFRVEYGPNFVTTI